MSRTSKAATRTLFVTPAGESVLIDTGNANGAVRDAGRIMDAVRDAHLTQIDHLILTHYHGDHFGGMEELSKQIPIKEFIDHGPNVQPGVGADWERDVYPKLYAKAKHTVPKPGDRIALKGVDWRIVASARRNHFGQRRCPAPTSPIRNAPISSRSTTTWKTRCRWRATSPSADSAPRISAI